MNIQRDEWVGGRKIVRIVFLIINLLLAPFLIVNVYDVFKNPSNAIIVDWGWRYSSMLGVQISSCIDATVTVLAIYTSVFSKFSNLLLYIVFWVGYAGYIFYIVYTLN